MNNEKRKLKVGQVEHFGLALGPSKYGYKLDRSWYGTIKNRPTLGEVPKNMLSQDGKSYSDEYYEKRLPSILMNFDINMAHFQALSREEFTNTVKALKIFNLKINKYTYNFEVCEDLKEYSKKGDYLYIMVLGQYKQLYIGKTYDLPSRIRRHWTANKEFDRLIFGGVDRSKISIDSFRAWDTTEILIMDCSIGNNAWTAEEVIVDAIPQKFVTNRMAGGEFEGGLIDAIKNRKEIEPSSE